MLFWSIYTFVGIIFSIFYTFYTPKIHEIGGGIHEWKDYRCWQKIVSEVVLNFLGCIIGWLALAYFIHIRFDIDSIILFKPIDFAWQDFVILLVSFYGITGYLPDILINKWIPKSQ